MIFHLSGLTYSHLQSLNFESFNFINFLKMTNIALIGVEFLVLVFCLYNRKFNIEIFEKSRGFSRLSNKKDRVENLITGTIFCN